jgi:ADP-ribose pyrophosphatase YjhB (NUDIX family)
MSKGSPSLPKVEGRNPKSKGKLEPTGNTLFNLKIPSCSSNEYLLEKPGMLFFISTDFYRFNPYDFFDLDVKQLKMYSYKYPRPAVTVDSVVFLKADEGLKILLIKRGHEPFKGMWAVPGGFIEMDETCEQAASRELEEETGLQNINLEQYHVFSAVHRDPRERIITIAHYVLLDNLENQFIKGSDDAEEAAWFSVSDLPSLAADHAEIIKIALQRLKEKKPELKLI